MDKVVQLDNFLYKCNPSFYTEGVKVGVNPESFEYREIKTLNENFKNIIHQLNDIHFTLMSDLIVNLMTCKAGTREEILLTKQNETLKTHCEMLRKEMMK